MRTNSEIQDRVNYDVQYGDIRYGDVGITS